MPPVPPCASRQTAEEQAQIARITAQFQELVALSTQQNLDRAVQLAEMARRHQLPKELEEHFGELGRRYADLVVDRGVKKGPLLRLVAQNGSEVGA
jgi:hypothetical protein